MSDKTFVSDWTSLPPKTRDGVELFIKTMNELNSMYTPEVCPISYSGHYYDERYRLYYVLFNTKFGTTNEVECTKFNTLFSYIFPSDPPFGFKRKIERGVVFGYDSLRPIVSFY